MFTYDLTDEDYELPYNRPGKSSSYFELDDEVGRGRTKHRADVIKLETILGNSGDMDLDYVGGPTGLGEEPLDKGLRAYQKRNGLKVDGWARPGGPTITKMKEQFGGLLGDYQAPSPRQSDTHHRMRDAGFPGFLKPKRQDLLMPPIPGLPAPSDTILGANHSLVRTVRDGGMQDVAGWMAQRVRSGGDGVVEARNFVDQLDGLMPGEGTKAIRGILQRLADTPALQRQFFGGPVIELAPVGVFEPDGPQRYEEALKTKPWEEYELGRKRPDQGPIRDMAWRPDRDGGERPPEPLGTHKYETPEEEARRMQPMSKEAGESSDTPVPNDGLLDPSQWPAHLRGGAEPTDEHAPPTQDEALQDEEIHSKASASDYTEEDSHAMQVTQAQQPQQHRPREGQQRQPQRRPDPANPLTADPQPRGHDTEGRIPPVPAFRQDVFKTTRMREGWDTFNRALRVLPNAGPNETQVLRDMYAIEGGDIVHGENGSSSGITRTALTRMRELGALPEDLRRYQNPGDIPTDRRPEVMRAYFDLALRDVGGHAALESISDPTAARALASTIYYQGENGGARAIQAAARRLGTPEELASDPSNRPQGAGSRVRQESVVGPWTLDVFNRIASDPQRRDALFEALSDERIREHERRWGPIERGGRRIVDLFRPPTP